MPAALAAVLAARTPTICGLEFHDRRRSFLRPRVEGRDTRAVASNDISTSEPSDDIPAECSSVVTPAPLPFSVTAMRSTAHSVSSTRRPPDDVAAGPSSAILPAHPLPPGTSTGGVTGSRHLEDSRIVLLPTPLARGQGRRDEGRRRDNATIAVVRRIIVAAGLRRDRLCGASGHSRGRQPSPRRSPPGDARCFREDHRRR